MTQSFSDFNNALESGRKSDKPKRTTICALVQLVNMYDEVGGLCDTELKELALNYARILKDGPQPAKT